MIAKQLYIALFAKMTVNESKNYGKQKKNLNMNRKFFEVFLISLIHSFICI